MDNIGFMLRGSLETTANILIYNSSSFYGYLEDESSSGDGFVLEIPLNYNGANATLDITVSGESYSGRKVEASGYIDLAIGKGDLTAPIMEFLDTIPSDVVTGEDLSFNFNVTDPLISGEYRSGLDTLMLLWTFNGGEVHQDEYIAVDLEGEWIVTIDTSQIGVYELIIVGVDTAGNVQYLGDESLPIIIEITPVVFEFNEIIFLSILVPSLITTTVFVYKKKS